MKKYIAVKIIAFILLFSALFYGTDSLVRRKSLFGTWNSTTKLAGFYNSPKNEYDVIFFGSSNTYCSFNPLILWEESKIKSYVFATQNQPLWATYYYMKDAFKYQSPKIAVLDVLMMSKNVEYYDDGVNYSFADDMPFSSDKIRLAYAAVPQGKRFDLLVPFTKYHSRWAELNEEDYTFWRSHQHDYLRGYTLLEETKPDAAVHDLSKLSVTAELYEKNVLYLKKIIDLCAANGVQLWLVKTPDNPTPTQAAYFRSVAEFAKQNNIFYTDFNDNYTDIGLIMSEDFYDKSHLNYRGAEKFTRYLAEQLPISASKEVNDTSDDWNACLTQYYNYINTLSTK